MLSFLALAIEQFVFEILKPVKVKQPRLKFPFIENSGEVKVPMFISYKLTG